MCGTAGLRDDDIGLEIRSYVAQCGTPFAGPASADINVTQFRDTIAAIHQQIVPGSIGSRRDAESGGPGGGRFPSPDRAGESGTVSGTGCRSAGL